MLRERPGPCHDMARGLFILYLRNIYYLFLGQRIMVTPLETPGGQTYAIFNELNDSKEEQLTRQLFPCCCSMTRR